LVKEETERYAKKRAYFTDQNDIEELTLGHSNKVERGRKIPTVERKIREKPTHLTSPRGKEDDHV